jgi:hypothetical protein
VIEETSQDEIVIRPGTFVRKELNRQVREEAAKEASGLSTLAPLGALGGSI